MTRILRMPLLGLIMLSLAACASAPLAPQSPEKLAQSCIEQGCWMPTVLNVTHVYSCSDGAAVRTHFDPASNRLLLQRGDAEEVALVEQREPPGSRDFRYVGDDLIWTPVEGTAALAVGLPQHSKVDCILTRIEQRAPNAIVTLPQRR
jgi:hypothetical protein